MVFFSSFWETGHAIERLGYIGQSWSFPVYLKPTKSWDEVTYHFDTAYFLNEKWSATFSLDAQVAGRQYFLLELGPDFYPIQDVIIMPWITGRFLYTMLPNGNIGWVSEVGFETHLSASQEGENFRLRISSGAGQLFVGSDNLFFIETARVGLLWSF